MGGGSRNVDAFKRVDPIGTPPIRDPGNWYDPLPEKRGGLFGSGMDGNDFVNVLARAAALANGDYGGAAQIGQLIGKPKRQAADDERELRLYDRKQQIEQKYAKPPAPYRFQDNAGNQMELDPVTGKVRPIFVDPSDRVFMANGGTVKVPNALRQSQSSSGVPKGYDPNEWEVVPSPQGGAERSPPQTSATLTPEQWQAAVQALGLEKANAWLRRGNIRVGGR